METPPKYKQYLNQGICDEQMLSDVIYSYNKRAKNHRDKSNEYRKCRYDKYDNEGKSLEKMETYYGKKDKLLKLFPDKILCIHKHAIKKRRRVYDYQKEYKTITDYVYSNLYYDWDKDDYVRFVDIEEDVVNYYLYFHVGDKTFHSPIKMDINKFIRNNGFQQLKIIDLPEDFYTQGKNTNSLLSVQFCDKVYERFISQAG